MKRSPANGRRGPAHEAPLVQTPPVRSMTLESMSAARVHALRRYHRRAGHGWRGFVAAPEATSESGLDVPSMRQVARVAWRTMRLRCANCGRGKVLRSFGSVNNRCSSCGLRFWRGEEDYFSGALLFGLTAGFVLALLGVLVVVASTWPDVPWRGMRLIGIPLFFLGMIILYPVSKVVWIAVDVLLRPVHPSELRPGLRPHRP